MGEPKPLDKEALIESFVPDATCTWVVVYAGPCLAGDCEAKGRTHDQLYIVPMIGWLHFIGNGAEIRPAVMASSGIVTDYLDVPPTLRFVAVLQDSETTVTIAHAIYHQRFGDSSTLDPEPIEELTLPN